MKHLKYLLQLCAVGGVLLVLNACGQNAEAEETVAADIPPPMIRIVVNDNPEVAAQVDTEIRSHQNYFLREEVKKLKSWEDLSVREKHVVHHNNYRKLVSGSEDKPQQLWLQFEVQTFDKDSIEVRIFQNENGQLRAIANPGRFRFKNYQDRYPEEDGFARFIIEQCVLLSYK